MTFGMRPILTSRWNEKRYLAGSETGVEQKASQPAPRSFTFSRRAAPPAAAGRTCLRASCPDLSRCAEDLTPAVVLRPSACLCSRAPVSAQM
jgi:hypothetical protein